MTDTNVPPERPAREPTTCATVAADLRRIAAALDAVSDIELQADPYVTLGLQPGGTDQQVAARTDAIGRALFGKPGAAKRMGGNTWHYAVDGQFGVVRFDVYDGIADPETPAREDELARLREENARLRAAAALTPDADPTGLLHSRADEGPAEDMTLTQPGLVPPTDPGDLPGGAS